MKMTGYGYLQPEKKGRKGVLQKKSDEIESKLINFKIIIKQSLI